MAKKNFIVEFEFTATSANGENYTRQIAVEAKTAREADNAARVAGWEAFGERFSENCVDWRVVQ